MRVVDPGTKAQVSISMLLVIDPFVTADTVVPVNIFINDELVIGNVQVTMQMPEIRPWALDVSEVDASQKINLLLALDTETTAAVDAGNAISDIVVTKIKNSELPLTIKVAPVNPSGSIVVQWFAVNVLAHGTGVDAQGNAVTENVWSIVDSSMEALSSVATYETPWTYTCTSTDLDS